LVPLGIGYACGGLTRAGDAAEGGRGGAGGQQSTEAESGPNPDGGDAGNQYRDGAEADGQPDGAACDLNAALCESGLCCRAWQELQSASSAQVTSCSLELDFEPADWAVLRVFVGCSLVPSSSGEDASYGWTADYSSPPRVVFGTEVCSRLSVSSDLPIDVILLGGSAC
jgi:hypothetical protein